MKLDVINRTVAIETSILPKNILATGVAYQDQYLFSKRMNSAVPGDS